MRISHILAATAAAALTIGVPAFAQMQSDSMKKGDMSSNMKMSAADKKMMSKCNGMSKDMMMKDKGCMKMMKMHPDMMKSS